MAIRAEYIWIDGTKPLPYVRSKTKIIDAGTTEFPIWGFDGSSTNQAPGDNSDCVLRPVFTCPDPIRGGEDVLVLADVCLPDGNMTPHPTNTRAACVETYEKYADQEPIFGIEQEYTFFRENRPLGWPIEGYPAPQGPYYCGVGAIEIAGDAHRGTKQLVRTCTGYDDIRILRIQLLRREIGGAEENIDFSGIDFLGERWDAYGILLIGAVINLLNGFLSAVLYDREKFLSRLLGFSSAFLSLLILLAIGVIVGAN